MEGYFKGKQKNMERYKGREYREVAITPRKWVPITPITPLFERAIDLYNTQSRKIKI